MNMLGNPVSLSLGRILLATDFSPRADLARRYAESLAQRFQSTIRLIHVVGAKEAFRPIDASDIFRRYGQEALMRLQSEIAADHISVETLLAEGASAAQVILDASHDRGVDLLVIGTRGHKGIARLVLGSTAEQLIHQAECPILTIGPHVPYPDGTVNFQTIVYATDFSPEAAKAGVFALSLAKDFAGRLYLCHVAPRPGGDEGCSDQELNERFIKALRSLIPDVAQEWCEPECVLDHGHAADGIRLLAKRLKADLIVLGTRQASHWFSNFSNGVAFQVVSESTCPVLTIRA
jgi:nucleotide-binding universal stress UspA family protein